MEEKLNQIIELIKTTKGEITDEFNKKINYLDEKFEAKYNQIIKEISFELRETGDVMYQAMDRKDNKSKDEIKHYMQNKEEQKLNLIKSTVNNLIKLNDQNLHQMV